MTLQFEWPACAANRDRLELEYISALGQSGPELRQDGTISADDMVAFIKSRHGLNVSPLNQSQVVQQALVDLAGDPRPAADHIEGLDIPARVSLLLIPFLLDSARHYNNNNPTINPTINNDNDNDTVRHQESTVMAQVLAICKRDMLSTTQPLRLNRASLRDILAALGECSSPTDQLLDEMIQLAAPPLHGPNDNSDDDILLDEAAFARALTSDVQHHYDLDRETSLTNHYADFLHMTTRGAASSSKEPTNDVFCKIKTASTIDLNTDRFQSDRLFVVIFLAFMICFLAYFAGEGAQYVTNSVANCGDNFGCRVGYAIGDWLWLFIQLGLLGVVGVYLLSGGNENYEDRCAFLIGKQLAGIGMIVVFFILPFWVNYENFMARVGQGSLSWAPYLCLLLGVFLLLLETSMLLRHIFPHCKVFFTTSCITKKEQYTKISARFKVNQMVEHAMAYHIPPAIDTTTSSAFVGLGACSRGALLNFQQREKDVETVGGIFWVWEKINHLLVKQGIWLGARRIAVCVSQVVAILAFSFFLWWSLQSVHRNYNNDPTTVALAEPRSLYYNASGSFLLTSSEAHPDVLQSNNLTFGYQFDTSLDSYEVETPKERLLRNTLNAMRISRGVTAIVGMDSVEILLDELEGGLYNATGIELSSALAYVELYASFQGNFMSFVWDEGIKRVSEKEATIALIFGGVCGLLAMIHVAIHYIPSSITQTLMLRHGVFIPSPLTDERFASLRLSPWVVTKLFGGGIWGIVATGFLLGGLTGFILFLCVWSETSEYLLALIAQLIGLVVSLLLKVVILFFIKKTCYDGLYRNKPVMANIVTMILECWNVGVAIGFILARTIKLILITCLYIGRIDTPFLSPFVQKIGWFHVDEYPDAFTTDLLIHEAHRHPYLERLGLMYMLKIHHGNAFATRAGSCWRLIFTLILFPWLRQYRLKEIRDKVILSKLPNVEEVEMSC